MQALVVGGTSGLGACLADVLKADSVSVLQAGRRGPVVVDVRQADSVAALAEEVDNQDGKYNADGPLNWVFWVAGVGLQGSLIEQGYADVDRLVETNLTGLIKFLQSFMLLRQQDGSDGAFHLVVVSSTSAFKARQDEAIYCATKAAVSQFVRCMGLELPQLLPGSRVTLVQPGGMDTAFYEGTGRDTSMMMSPAAVADIIWQEVQAQTEPFAELTIFRRSDGQPLWARGPQLPE